MKEERVRRILLVDSDEPFRKLLHRTLRMAGYYVEEAKDGEQAFKVYRQRGADLIITELAAPEGNQIIAHLCRLDPALKIIGMSNRTAGNPAASLPGASKLRTRLTLLKPFSQQEILDAVSDVFAGAA